MHSFRDLRDQLKSDRTNKQLHSCLAMAWVTLGELGIELLTQSLLF